MARVTTSAPTMYPLLVLCRPVMSDPGQVLSARQLQTYRPGMKRGSIRTLHDSK